MRAHLRAESEHEPALRQLLQRPRRQRGDGGAAGECHGHRGSEANARGGGGAQRQELVGIIFGLLHQNRIEADGFGLTSTVGELCDAEGRVRFAHAGVELAEREQRLDQHGSNRNRRVSDARHPSAS